jgi:hypothetical protein
MGAAQQPLSLHRLPDLIVVAIDRTPIPERYDPVPKGRLKIAQDVVLGKTSASGTVPSGTAEHRSTGFLGIEGHGFIRLLKDPGFLKGTAF